MNTWLLLHNLGYTISIFVTLAVSFFVFFRGARKDQTIIFLLLSASLIVFEVSHLLGVNVSDGVLSQRILMFNLVNIFIVIFNTHWVLAVLNKVKDRLFSLSVIYVSGVLLLVFYLIFPDTFLLPSVSKMYFPNYYVAGSLYLHMRWYFIVVSLFFIWEVLRAYFVSVDDSEKRKFRYVITGILFGYGFGSTALFLVFNILINPIWSVFIGLYTIPFVYAMVNYKLMDIKVVAKQAFFYSVSVGLLSGLISLISFSNEWLGRKIPDFPSLLLPVLSSVVAVGIGFIVWRKVREADILKYEFITVVTHKFRTPLTAIKWSAEALKSPPSPGDFFESVNRIKSASEQLVELTNILANLSDSEDSDYRYTLRRIDFPKLVSETIDSYRERFSAKLIYLGLDNISSVFVNIDGGKIQFVMQTLIENALSYTPKGGQVQSRVYIQNNSVVFSVKDSGIGVPLSESRYIFSKFFRASNAKSADTEGMGVGLFMSRTIIERHGGKMWIESSGEGGGTTVSFSLPVE